jgi:hypothetical protein
MKKMIVGVVAVGVALGLSFNVYSAEVKETTTVKGDTTVEKTEVKAGNMKATEKVTTTPEGTMTEQKVEGKNVKMEKKEVTTAEGTAGKTKVHIKKGAINKFNVDYVYYQQGTEYIIEYKVNDKADPELLQEMGLTAEQAQLVEPGMHKIVSTSPYTAGDIKADFQQMIVADLKAAAEKMASKKK